MVSVPYQLDSLQYNDSPFHYCMTPFRNHHLLYIERKYISYLSLTVKFFSCNLFLTKFEHLLFINTFLISTYQAVKSNFYVSFFSSSGTHQSITRLGCQAIGRSSSLFLGLTLFIPIVPVNNLIIIIIIVIMPYFYLPMCHKPIRKKPQRIRVFPYRIITHLLCLKVIRDIVQLPWVYFKGLDTHFLCFKMIRDKKNAAGFSRIASSHIFCILR